MWIVSVLFKGDDKVAGLCRAVSAPNMARAAIRGNIIAERFAIQNGFTEFFVTNVGIADMKGPVPEDCWWTDPLADPEEDWKELRCSAAEE